MKYRTYLLFGPPGSGKGTNGRVLGSIPGFCYFACGDAFRSLDVHSQLGRTFARYSSKGKLVPDSFVIDLWHACTEEKIAKGIFDPSCDCLVLDGIPRNINQALILEELLDVKRVFHLTLPTEEELFRRMLRRARRECRQDDSSEATVRRRLQTYKKETLPLLEILRACQNGHYLYQQNSECCFRRVTSTSQCSGKSVAEYKRGSMSSISSTHNHCLVEPEQREITRICMSAAQMLMQHGAESALVESVTVRLGRALGLENVQVGLTANSLTLTTISNNHCITTLRRNIDHGINMHVVTEVQRLMLLVEEGNLTVAQTHKQLEMIKPLRYPKWIVSIMIGLSCGCFARLMGADWLSCLLTCGASGVAMTVRQILSRHHFNPLVNFAVTAFVATSVSCVGTKTRFFGKPELAMAASVLLLIPGFPLINAVSDMVKGYPNTGLARWTIAMLLMLASSLGILLALVLWKVRIWI